jgi:hypothetical protein
MPQPLGLHLGALKPPDPLGMPAGRTAEADISFSTSWQLHSGQDGGASSLEKARYSKLWQQPLH